MARISSPSGPTRALFYCASVFVRSFACGVAVALACAGCAPDAAATNQPSSRDAFPANKVLTSSDESAVLNAFNDAAQGSTPRPLVAAPDGYRWTDVPGALRAAAASCELGVSAVDISADEVVATLKAADGQRGRAVAVRAKDGVSVTATIGLLGNAELEAKFARVFSAALQRMGAVRRPQD